MPGPKTIWMTDAAAADLDYLKEKRGDNASATIARALADAAKASRLMRS